MKNHLSIALLALLSGAWSSPAQSFHLNWQTIDGGGARCAGGAFALHGTVGQPESSGELRSDLPTLASALSSTEPGLLGETVYALRGGFWPGVVVDPVGPALAIRLDDLNHVTLSWPFPSPNYVLQQATGLSAPGGSWATIPIAPIPVGTNWLIGFRTTNSARMYRLFHQH